MLAAEITSAAASAQPNESTLIELGSIFDASSSTTASSTSTSTKLSASVNGRRSAAMTGDRMAFRIAITDLLQLDLRADQVQRGRVRHPRTQLPLHRLADLGDVVAEQVGQHPAEEVQIAAALGVGDPAAGAGNDLDRLGVVQRHPGRQHGPVPASRSAEVIVVDPSLGYVDHCTLPPPGTPGQGSMPDRVARTPARAGTS